MGALAGILSSRSDIAALSCNLRGGAIAATAAVAAGVSGGLAAFSFDMTGVFGAAGSAVLVCGFAKSSFFLSDPQVDFPEALAAQ